MNLSQYVESINSRYSLGNATEHSYRGDLQQLIESIVPDVIATNEPKRQKCGAPDFILTNNKDIPLGYIEAKTIGDDDLEGIKKTGNKEQFDRYKSSLGTNIIFTDYIHFYFYQDNELITNISIAEITESGIKALTNNFSHFEHLIQNFCVHVGQTIKSPKKLAQMMAGKAILMSHIIENAITNDENKNEDSTLKDQMNAFKSILMHDITEKGFSDVYAQTIAYGMFAARLHDPTLETFSRQEAAELIPKTNPFLRKLFGYIAGPDLDDRIKWLVDDLVKIFLACNVEQILKNYGKSTKMEDPIIHFYETFLSEYDPKLRKSRGVWYTPQPVVNFIIRAVDDILKSEFGLSQGLADTSKTKIKVNLQATDKRYKDNKRTVEQEVHKVQILDPATGTGTFLAEVIKHIHKNFKGQEGIWSNYVDKDLIPRLNGFEILMASYAMAHLKLDLLLSETGYKSNKDNRFNVYLTNSLEESHPDTGTLFASWLSSEANEANHIKRDTPVMCIIGNPPYNSSSNNQGKWIETLIKDYKKNLDEQNYNSLSDDYVKFIRYAQYFVDKNKNGVVAMITNNSFIDGITQKQMRYSLKSSFDKIYIYDLHGSSKRKEKALDGSPDENIFDIQQGVSINILIKNNNIEKKDKGVYHYEVLGTRKLKFANLLSQKFNSISWIKLDPKDPKYFFVPKNLTGEKSYNRGFDLNTFFIKKGNGIKFRKDNLLVKNNFKKVDVEQMLDNICNSPASEIYEKYNFKPTNDWDLKEKKQFFKENDTDNIISVNYRQFDKRYTYYPIKNIHEIIVRGDSRRNLMKHYFQANNLGLVIGRQGQVVGDIPWNLVFISKLACDMNIFYRGGGINFPLYLYPDSSDKQTLEEIEDRNPNLDQKIIDKIAKKLKLNFICEKEANDRTFAPIDLLDYIYAILHSGKYRDKYKEFLKTDFPKIPYPKDKKTFWQLVKLGSEIRKIHLLESSVVEDYITSYPKDGDNKVTTKISKNDWELFDQDKQLGRIWINEDQFFDNIPLIVWEFYIGGYQPAQKWLKDRRGRVLETEDIFHYQKIIVALFETDRIMKLIDKIDFE